MILYDPVRQAELVTPKVTKYVGNTELRKYFRFRGGRWYGGIASADVIGCNMACKFCWSWYFRSKYDAGEFLSPAEAYERLKEIAEKRGYRLMRLTGGEPTLSRKHLLDLITMAEGEGYVFIVETNGILLGHDATYARDLASHTNVFVRVSFKGVTEEEYYTLTGADPSTFDLQFQALRNLIDYGLVPGKEVVAAAMVSFSKDSDIARFLMRLSEIDERLVDSVDWEVVILYPHVKELLRRYKLRPKRYVEP